MILPQILSDLSKKENHFPKAREKVDEKKVIQKRVSKKETQPNKRKSLSVYALAKPLAHTLSGRR